MSASSLGSWTGCSALPHSPKGSGWEWRAGCTKVATAMSPCRVLVIDDNEAHRQVVAEVLADEGYQVAIAASGEAGLAAARAVRPDVLLLDLLMPGMDGASVLEELRRDADLAGVRVVVTTGVQTPHVKRLLHPDAVLFKPFGVSELLRAVEDAVKGPPSLPAP